MKRAESDLEGLPIHPREAKVAEADEAARHEHVRRLDVAVEHLRRSDEIRAEMHVEMSCDHRREDIRRAIRRAHPVLVAVVESAEQVEHHPLHLHR